MTRNYSKKFFLQKGKSLIAAEIDSLQPTAFPKEAISSLASVIPTRKEVILTKIMDLKSGAKSLASLDFIKIYSGLLTASSIISLLILVFVFNIPVVRANQKVSNKYSIFASKPLTLDTTSQDLTYRDSRAVRIDSAFKFFNCPMYGLGSKFVEEADKNDLPYWVAASIAFQESSCGKNTPKADGVESNNAWGWATYGDQVYSFDSWDQGIEVVSKYLNNRFYSRGVTELCDIMKVYTPPSNGSWCKGVGYFGDFIQNYKTPQI